MQILESIQGLVSIDMCAKNSEKYFGSYCLKFLSDRWKGGQTPNCKVHGTNMGPTWVMLAPYIGPMLAPWTLLSGTPYYTIIRTVWRRTLFSNIKWCLMRLFIIGYRFSYLRGSRWDGIRCSTEDLSIGLLDATAEISQWAPYKRPHIVPINYPSSVYLKICKDGQNIVQDESVFQRLHL